MTAKPKKEPKRVTALLAKMRGQRLVVTNKSKILVDEEPDYSLDPSGLKVGPDTARRAIALGKLVPVEDGLFPGMSQTFILAAHA